MILPKYKQELKPILNILLVMLIIQILSWLLPTFTFFSNGIPNYLPLHVFLETFSIVISMMVFAICWNSHSRDLPGNIVLLACLSFTVGMLDFSHTLSYIGMPDFITFNDAQKQLNFWLPSRFIAAFSLFLISVRSWEPLKSEFTRYIIICSLFIIYLLWNWLVIYHQGVLPDTFIPGLGLTPFKKNIEYLIIAINLISALILFLKMQNEQSFNVPLIFGAVCTMAMSEFFFTLDTTMTGSYNVLGHLFKVVSYIFMYRAVVVETIEVPYEKLKNAQVDLSNSEKKLDSILQTIIEGIVTINPNGQITYANQAASDILNIEKNKITEKYFQSQEWHQIDKNDHPIPPEQLPLAITLTTQNKVTDYEHAIIDSQGNKKWLSVNSAPVFDETGKMVSAIASFRDITASINTANEKEKMNSQLIQSERLASMGMLAAGVAHEINNPLAYIMLNLEDIHDVLLNNPTSDEISKLAPKTKSALTGVERVSNIVKSLKSFSRPESDSISLIDIQGPLDAAINMCFNEIKYKATLETDFSKPSIYVLGNEGQLSQVFLNILVNATQAIREGDVEHNKIKIRSWREKDMVCISISDTGCGITKENLKHLYEPFFTTKSASGGTGLGLVISLSLIKRHQGIIEIDSKENQGTTFTIQIPVSKPPIQNTSIKSSIIIENSHQRKRYLVIDDEKEIRNVLARILQDDEVITADSGETAQNILLKDQNFDFIICDMMMPKMTGMDLYDWLEKAHPEMIQKIIFITGTTFTARGRSYFNKVGERKLEKPFTKDALQKLLVKHSSKT